MTNIYVSSGQSVSNTVLNYGNAEYISAGGIATGTTINSGGGEYILKSGTAIGTVVNSGGYEYINAGATASSTTLNSGGDETIYNSGVASGASVSNGGEQLVMQGGIAFDTTVYSGGVESLGYGGKVSGGGNVFSGGEIIGLVLSTGAYNVNQTSVVDGITVQSGGILANLAVESGASTQGLVVNSGGYETIFSSSTASSTTINSGAYVTIYSGGTAIGSIINNGGIETINNGGTVSGGSVASGGEIIGLVLSSGSYSANQTNVVDGITLQSGAIIPSLTVDSGASAQSFVVNYGYGLVISAGGTVSGTTINTGYQIISGGTASNTVINAGNEWVTSGGIAISTIINSGGNEIVSSGGTTSATTLNNGGNEVIFTGGKVNGLMINSGGYENIDGGITSSTVINSHGEEYISQGTASGTTVNSGGIEYIYSGTAIGTTVNSGGFENIYYGTVSGGSVASGGRIDGLVLSSGSYNGNQASQVVESVSLQSGSIVGLTVAAGASTQNFMVTSGGYETINSGATASSTVVNSGGQESVSGIAISSVVDSGGNLTINNGGVASATTINNGGIENLNSGGVDIGVTVKNGGELVIGYNYSNQAEVVNLNSGAILDFAGITVGSAIVNGANQLQLSNNGTVVATLDLNGNYSNDTFSTQSDGIGGTLVQVSTAQATLSSVSYNAANGQLSLVGSNLATSAGGYVLTDLSLTGDGGVSYTLTSGSVVSGTPTSTGLTIQLSTADQLAVDGLLNKSGNTANDGVNSYSLSAGSGWQTSSNLVQSNAYSYTTVADPNATGATVAIGINNSGEVVGNYFDSAGAHGFIDNNGVYTTLNDPNGVGNYATTVTGINNGGVVLGSFENAQSDYQPFVYSAGSYTTITDPNATVGSTVAYGITDSGLVYGTYVDSAGVSHGFIDNAGAYTTTAAISDPAANASGSSDYGVNASGQVVGSYFSGANPTLSGFIYNGSSYVTLQEPNATTGNYSGTSATAINNSGQVAGFFIDPAGKNHGFVYNPLTNNYTAVDAPSAVTATGARAFGISDNGQVVGMFLTAQGSIGFIATPVVVESVTVNNVSAPTISSVAYNAASGLFTVTGANLDNHGSSNGIALNDFTLTGGANGSYSFSAANDTVSNLSSSGFTVSLSNADKTAVNSIVNANGAAPLSGAAYNLAATANWDSDSGAAINSLAVVASNVQPSPTVSHVSYNAGNGQLTLTGSHLTSGTGAYLVSDFSLQGDGGGSYSLTSGSVVAGATSSSVTIKLSSADQLAVDGLLNKNGLQANDGATAYNLSAAGGWDTAAAAINTEAVTVSGVIAPSLSKVSYNAASAVLTVTGSHLDNAGSANGITLSDFTISNGAGELFSFPVASFGKGPYQDSVVNLTASGFTINLNKLSQSILQNILDVNGSKSISGTAYNLTASANWDSDNGVVITTQAITVNGALPIVSAGNYSAATGKLTLLGANFTNGAGGYTVTDFSLTGDNGASYTLTSGSVVSGAPSTSSLTIQLSTADQLAVDGLLNKAGTLANDGVTGYSFSSLSGWDTGATAISATGVVVSNVTAPSLSKVNYNAGSGVFTVTGAHLDNHGSANGIALADLSLTVGSGSYHFNSSTDMVSNLSATGFTVSLGSADQNAVNALINNNGSKSLTGATYSLSTTANWDSDTGAAISSQSITVSGLDVLNSKLGSSPLSISNLVEGSGQIELSKTIYTAFAGATAVTTANFSNAASAGSSTDYLYYNANNGGLYYDADGSGTHSNGVEIAVIGVSSHPAALSVADFKLIA